METTLVEKMICHSYVRIENNIDFPSANLITTIDVYFKDSSVVKGLKIDFSFLPAISREDSKRLSDDKLKEVNSLIDWHFEGDNRLSTAIDHLKWKVENCRIETEIRGFTNINVS